jgi:hypothetical protein
MNWYKMAKSLRDIALDPNEDSKDDNWDKVHMDSDLNAIMMRMYRSHVHPETVDETDVDKAITELKSDEVEGKGMWRKLSIEMPEYIDDLKAKAEKKYPSFYEETKKAEEGVVPLPDPSQQGGMPGGMPGGDLGGLM